MRTAWRKASPWLRLAAGIAVLVAIVRGVGAQAFLSGLRRLDLGLIVAALAITAGTTACCAWRWRLVVRGVGGELGLRAAVGAYYRSQFLDAALPGGVLGDAYRGVQRGLQVNHLGRGLRTVFWERVFGQFVQVILSILVLAAWPSPARRAMPIVLGVAVAALVAGAVAVRLLARGNPAGRWRRATLHALAELRGLTGRAWAGIALASALAIAGYVAIFVLACHAVGVALPSTRLLPLLLLVLVAAAVPLNVAGFGPREGVAAWAFGAVGAGADQGVAAATLYGVLGLIAVLPGALLMLRDWPRS